MSAKRCAADTLKAGEWLSSVVYYQVDDAEPDGKSRICVHNHKGTELTISPEIIEDECFSASQTIIKCEMTQTELQRVMLSAGQLVFTVGFSKKPVQKAVADQLADVDTSTMTPRARSMLVGRLIKGEFRELVGHLQYGVSHDDGRVRVIDLEHDNGLRLVDLRTIEWIKLAGVHYVKKGGRKRARVEE